MIIRRIKVSRFGCLDYLDVPFESGLNVIKGLNEAGKSTLHQALLMALLERPTKKKSNEDYRSWNANRLFELEIEYELQGKGRWVLVKDFEKNTVRLEEPSGEAITDWEGIQEALAGAVGTDSLKVFKSTICVAQDELAAITDGRKEISRSLEEILTGGEEDVHTPDAIAQLERAIQDYRRGYETQAPKNPGPLAQLTQQQREYERIVNEHRSTVSGQDEAQERLIVIEVRLDGLEEELNPRLAARDLADNTRELASQLQRWQEQESSLESTLERIAEAERQIAEAETRLAHLNPVVVLTEAEIQDLTHLNERVRLLADRKDEAERLKANVQPPPDKQMRLSVKQVVLPGLLVFVGLAGLIAGVALSVLTRSILATFVGVGLGLLMFAGGMAWLVATLLSAKRSSQGMAEGGIPIVTFDETQLERAKQDLSDKLVSLDCAGWTAFEQKREEVQATLASRDNSWSRLEGLLPVGRTKESLEIERKEARRKRQEFQDKMDKPDVQRAARLSLVEYQTLSHEIHQLTKEQDELEIERVKLRARFEEAKITREDLLRTEEHLVAISREVERAKERLKVYELALETLLVARHKTLIRVFFIN